MFYASKEQEEAHKKWLASLAVGDDVCIVIPRRFYGDEFEFVKVAKITATQIVVFRDGGRVECRFRREGGRRVGGSYFAPYIEKPTQKHRDELTRREHLSKLKGQDWDKLTNEQLNAVVDTMKAYW